MPTMFSTLLTGILVFVVVYLRFYWPRRNRIFYFDPGGRKGEFEPHAERYQSLAKLLLTLASASAAFLVNFLCLSAGSCIVFMLLENLYYEDYIHSKFPSEGTKPRETYTGKRYALILTLSGMGIVYFVLAYGVLAVWLFI